MRRGSLIAAFFVTLAIMALPLSAQEGAAARKSVDKEVGEAVKTELAVIEIEPFHYVAVEMTGSYTQHPDAFMKLYSAAGQQGLPMSGAPFGIYWNSPNDTAEEDLKWEIGMPVSGDKEIAAPIVLKKWEFTTVIQRDFEGTIDSDEIKAVYFSMYGWIEANGYELAGPMLERFLNTPSPNEKGEMIGKVQIVFPVQKKK
jgi:effector-binding domain-containing protein